MQNKPSIPAVNFHLWEPCNMRCGFCFARFQDVKASVLPKGHLPKEDALEVVRRLAAYGFQKITFVGGEPTLCPWLADLIEEAKQLGLITMLVTNGSKLTPQYMKQFQASLDWLCLSIDSLDPEINQKTGRYAVGKKQVMDETHYRQLIQQIKDMRFRLKINTVVHQFNAQERLADFIEEVAPERWKIFQVLRVEGQNEGEFDRFSISKELFQGFLSNNQLVGCDIPVIAENNELMRGSYVMVDPAGRFFDNVGDVYRYSPPILALGVEQALAAVRLDRKKFDERDGGYFR